jgi:threonine/homoserine/homoserine lactone efflux protein
MDLGALLVFATVYAVAVVTPGPGVTALVARVLGRGVRGAPALIAGYVAGDLVWFTGAALGLTALLHALAGAFVFIKWAGVACSISPTGCGPPPWPESGSMRHATTPGPGSSSWRGSP